MPESVPKPVDMSVDAEVVSGILTGFIQDCIEKTHSRCAVLGLSGGLDSSLVALLCAKALGPENVLGVIMPYRTSSPDSRADAESVVSLTGIRTETVDISPMVDAFYRDSADAGGLRRGNFMARQRMTVLYDISARESGLVIGTSNKSELLLGYGTVFGDMACAVNPVGDLYKTQIRQLAEYLGVPENIRAKKPTADLVEGQTDEGDLGFTYADADQALYRLIDMRRSPEELADEGYDPAFVGKIMLLVRRNHFKRIPPLIAKVSGRTIGHEFRYSWDWSCL